MKERKENIKMEKQYTFEVKQINKARGVVFAESKEEAKEKIMNYEYEDIFDEYDTEIVEVLEIKED